MNKMQHKEEEQQHGYNMRHDLGWKFESNYSYLQIRVELESDAPLLRKKILGHLLVTVQLSIQCGIEMFGNKAVMAFLQELGQIDEKGVVEPMDPNCLMAKQKQEVLNTITMVKEK